MNISNAVVCLAGIEHKFKKMIEYREMVVSGFDKGKIKRMLELEK